MSEMELLHKNNIISYKLLIVESKNIEMKFISFQNIAFDEVFDLG